MIIGTGVDIVEIERFLNNHQRLSKKILCESEMEIYSELGLEKAKVHYIAKRFAAKEAVAKAFGCGLGKDLGFKNIEISNDELGKPSAKIIGESNIIKGSSAMGAHHDFTIHLSISDSEKCAIAFVVIEQN